MMFEFGQFSQDLFLPIIELFRDLDESADEQVTARGAAVRVGHSTLR